MALVVEVARRADEELRGALNHLVPQLTSNAVEVTMADLEAIVSSDATTLLVAREGERIVGVCSLCVYRVPTGLKSWIEDVVVDESARGTGVGEALTLAAVEEARSRGLRAVDLTSRPSREAAHRLYRKLDFVERETSVYRRTL